MPAGVIYGDSASAGERAPSASRLLLYLETFRVPRKGPRRARSELGRRGRFRPPTTLVQSCPPRNPRPASRKGPTGPTLRANPCPEVTDQDCRFPLPTLIYRLEAPNLGDLMRRWVQSVSKQGLRLITATGSRRLPPPRIATRVTSSLTSFTDWRWCTGHRKNCGALRPPCGLSYHHPLLASYDFQGSRGLKQKRKLSPGPDTSGRKPDPVTRARHTYDPAPPGGRDRASPNTGHGIITVFPFATASLPLLVLLLFKVFWCGHCNALTTTEKSPAETMGHRKFILGLRPDSPMFN